MPALLPTDFMAKITWLGRVRKDGGGIRSVPLQAVEASYAGVAGEVHAGLTRAASGPQLIAPRWNQTVRVKNIRRNGNRTDPSPRTG